MSNHLHPVSKRVRFGPIAIGTGVLAAVLLSVTMSGTLSGFAASINNTNNTAASGSLIMQEQSSGGSPVTCLSTDGGTVSTNSSTCSTINKFGGSTTMVPGQTVTTTVTVKNAGSAPAGAFTIQPAACAQSNSGTSNGSANDLCSKLNLVLTNTTTSQVVYNGALSALGTTAITITTPPAAGVTNTFTFAVTLASTAGNTYQGLQASVPLTYAFAS